MAESDMTSSKLVFIDIDGTLADENHIVPESAKTACARAQANGHKLFICTGRSAPKIERNILDLGFDGVVSVAGAQANIGSELLFQHLVSPEAIDAAMAYFAEHHIESYQWQGADGMYISEGYRRHLESKGKTWNRGEFARFWHLLDEVEVPAGSTLGHTIHVSKGSYFTGPEPDVSFENTQHDLAPWFELVHGSYDKISPNNGELLINDRQRHRRTRRGFLAWLCHRRHHRHRRLRQRHRHAQSRRHIRGHGQRHPRHPGLLRHHYHRHPRQRSSQRLQDIGAGVTSAKSLPVAIAQFTVAEEPERNLEILDGFARDAAAGGAKLLVLPEGLIARRGDDDSYAAAHAQPLDGPFVDGLRRISAQRHIVLMGTVHVAPEQGTERDADSRVSNTFLVIRDGEIIAEYRKLHLYDAFSARESDVVLPGDALPPIVDIDGWKIGVMTCYDVRFPETARSLAVRGADAIVVSAAWVRGPLKEQHWKLLTAARALENTCYVLACSEVSSRNIGCSRIIDPMGEVVAEAGDEGAELIATGLSRECLASARQIMPVLQNRRFADPQLRD